MVSKWITGASSDPSLIHTRNRQRPKGSLLESARANRELGDRLVGPVVGEGMRGTPGLAGRLFQAISREDVNIIAIAQGSSELTISIIVRRDGLERPFGLSTRSAEWA